MADDVKPTDPRAKTVGDPHADDWTARADATLRRISGRADGVADRDKPSDAFLTAPLTNQTDFRKPKS